MNYYGVEGEEEEDVGLVRGGDEEQGDAYDGRTPLDRTLDRIGMGACVCVGCLAVVRGLTCALGGAHFVCGRAGSYQWTLLSLCGFGESNTRNDGALMDLDLDSS